MACHEADSTIPFAPKITNKNDWSARIAQGKEVLFKHAIEGYTGPDGGIMLPKGGNANLTDEEVKAAVIYMVNQSGGHFSYYFFQSAPMRCAFVIITFIH